MRKVGERMDREKVIKELDKLADEVNPWKESPPLRCDIPYSLLCDALKLLKEPVKQIEDFRNFVFNQNFSGKISERDLALINFWISRFEDDT